MEVNELQWPVFSFLRYTTTQVQGFCMKNRVFMHLLSLIIPFITFNVYIYLLFSSPYVGNGDSVAAVQRTRTGHTWNRGKATRREDCRHARNEESSTALDILELLRRRMAITNRRWTGGYLWHRTGHPLRKAPSDPKMVEMQNLAMRNGYAVSDTVVSICSRRGRPF
jgi:hypothetical protein